MALRMIGIKCLNSRINILKNFTSTCINRTEKFSQTSKSEDKTQTDSALYVSGNKASSTFSVLSPYLNFEKQFQDIAKLETNVKLRGLNKDIKKLTEMWTELKVMEQKKEHLEKERTSIAKLMKEFAKSKTKNEVEMQSYKKQGKEIRDQLKSINQGIWDLEEQAVIGALRLPNVLHKLTHHYDKELFKLFAKPSFDFPARSHRDLGSIHQELEFTDASPSAYYLMRRLALLELACNDYFLTNFKSHGYILQSNPDFAKAVVVEGCGVNIDNRVFALASHESDTDSNLQYLVGGGSMQAFIAYFTKQVINNPECLPQKLITVGRQYIPPTDITNPSLLNAGQSTVIDALVLHHNQSIDEELLLNEILMALVQSYSQLNIHFRLVQYSAQKLELQESAAIGLEMFSPCTGQYHEIGRVSLYGDFISRRLWSLYKIGSSTNFLSMIHIKVCHVSRLLAIIMENSQNEDCTYEIPTSLRTFVENI